MLHPLGGAASWQPHETGRASVLDTGIHPLWESLTPLTILCSGEARDASVVPERPHGNPLSLEVPVVTLTLVSIPCG